MCPFDWLILVHLAGDFLFQTEYEAMNKAQGHWWNRALLLHCLKYTLGFAVAFALLDISLPWLILIFVSHMALDRRFLVVLWRKYINRNSEESIANTFWLTIIIDQIFHILILALIGGVHG